MNKAASNQEDLQGQIQRVTYTHEDTDYAIVKIKVKGLRDLVTVIGNIPSPLVGQVLKMKGKWANHPKYGNQFEAAFCECAPPTTTAGIQKYLASGLIKGIGPATAKKIVNLFGDKTLDIIKYEAKRLNEIDGIGQKRVEMIEKAWIEQAEIRNVMMFLQGHGVSAKYASKIFKTYGQDSIQIVQENPYRLATDVFGIGFITSDEIAQKLGFDKESVFRVQAGILYVLHQLSNQGHVYYPAGHLVEKASEILEVEGSRIKECLG
jgi:exodeoxyribonuclease V alpha subunit